MKVKALVLALVVAGLASSVAIAKQPPGGKNEAPGQAKKEAPASSTSSTSTSTSTTTTAPAKNKGQAKKTATSTSTTVVEKKILICHRTGSTKKPYVLVKVSVKSSHAKLKHGDVMPVGGKCLAVAPGTGTTTTGTGTTGTTTGTTGTTSTTTGTTQT